MKNLLALSVYLTLNFYTLAYASEYADFQSDEKDDNNRKFLEYVKEHLYDTSDTLKFLVLDGPRLGSSTAISNYFEKLRSDNKRKLSPFILVPQISYDDYLSIGKNDAYQKIPQIIPYPHSINKFLNDYSNQFFPNAVYFDYMGSAGG